MLQACTCSSWLGKGYSEQEHAEQHGISLVLAHQMLRQLLLRMMEAESFVPLSTALCFTGLNEMGNYSLVSVMIKKRWHI